MCSIAARDLSLPGGAALAGVVAALDYGSLSYEQLVAAAAAVQRVKCWAERQDIEICARIAAEPDPLPDVSREFTSDALSYACRVSRSEAHRRLDRGEDACSGVLDKSLQALADGEITLWHVHVIGDALRYLPASEGRARAEAELTEQAVTLSVPRLRDEAERRAAELDPAAAEAAAEGERSLRSLRFGRRDGASYLAGQLPPELMAIVKGAIDARAAKTGREDERRIDVRRADALVGLCRREDKPGDPSVAPRRHPVGVLVPLPTLFGGDEAGRIVGGASLAPTTLRRLCCDAPLTALITDVDGHLLDIGRTSRYPDARLRTYLTIRDQVCQFPGCGVLAGSCEIHHAVFWEQGGTTDRVNCLCLCAHHHHLVHEGHWQLRRHPDQTTTWTSPNGDVRHVRPPLLPGARARPAGTGTGPGTGPGAEPESGAGPASRTA